MRAALPVAMSSDAGNRRVPGMRISIPSGLRFCLLLSIALPLPAQHAPIGLSEVRGRWFEDLTLDFYGPDGLDHFAAAVATGDFNGDGAEDLATGVPDDEDIDVTMANLGKVVVRWGVPGLGLASGPGATVLHQGLGGSPDPPEANDRFGAALAAGDFNGDGYDDLAVGVPSTTASEDVYGAVQIFYGWSNGFQTEHCEYITEEVAGGAGNISHGAEFGSSLTVGNFDHDAYDDLAIGAWMGMEWSFGVPKRSGAVYVAHGQDFGLLPWYGYRISQDAVDIQEEAEAWDQFGRAVAAGDFNPDSYDDLAIGVPGEGDHGIVQIIFGSQWGLLFAENVLWQPGAVGQEPEAGDRFGFSFAVGDFDGDLYEDLAIGDPSEDLGAGNELANAGRIVVAFGSNSGFDLARTIPFDQGTLYPGDPQANLTDEKFGWAMTVGDFDSDGLDDLVVGHPNDLDWAVGTNTGAVSVLMGGFGAGLGDRRRLLHPGWQGLPGRIQGGQEFGRAVAAGDFDGDGYSDLAIGAPGYDLGEQVFDSGGEVVLYGAQFADGFEAGSAERWLTDEP
jgi:hypothetical protein